MDGERTPSLNPYLRRPWTRGRIGGRTRKGALILLGIVLAYVLLLGESGWFRQMRLEGRKKALLDEVESLENQVKLLEAEALRLKTDSDYRMKIAYEDWGYIGEGEKIYHLRYME